MRQPNMCEEMNIFLIEDNDLDVEIFKRSLKKECEAGVLHRARDGVEALEMLSGSESDGTVPVPFVILLDINMPRMNGHEFLAELRKTEGIRDSRVFIFTTSDSPKDISLAYERNANGYIVKPSSSSQMREVISLLKSYWSICKHPVRHAA